MWQDACNWGQLALIPVADHLNSPAFKPVKESLKDMPGHCANFVLYYDAWDELLAHLLQHPVGFATSPKEAMVCLGFHRSSPHLSGVSGGSESTPGDLSPGEVLSLLWFYRCSPPPLR